MADILESRSRPADKNVFATDRGIGSGRSPSDQAARPAVSSIVRWFGRVVLAAQCGQMRRVLENMPDHVLEEIGIARSQIHDYARSIVYDQDP
ncbi:MAG: hypothetical protein AAF724_01070 [Pseudomonadota bacterium]